MSAQPLDSVAPAPEDAEVDWDSADRRAWLLAGIFGAAVIAIEDGCWSSSLFWLLGSWVRAYYGMPAVIRVVRRVIDPHRHLFLGTAAGWALYPGPLVGGCFGVLVPWIWGVPLSALAAGLLGLVLGPILAAGLGLMVAIVLWLFLRLLWPESAGQVSSGRDR